MLDWHDHILAQSVVPVAPYNPRNTADPLDIDYRVEQRIKEHGETVRLWRQQLEERYSCRSQIETAIGVCKDLGLKTGVPRPSESQSTCIPRLVSSIGCCTR